MRARSQQDKGLRRTHLIAAATRLFADADFDAVTIARVAEAAGVAKGTAYIYFATKETLFLELVRAEMTQRAGDQHHPTRQPTPGHCPRDGGRPKPSHDAG